MQQKRSFPGLLFGLAAGAVLGVLLAPRSGKETRQRLSTDTDNFFKNLQDQLQEGIDGIKSQYNDLMEANAARTKDDMGRPESRV